MAWNPQGGLILESVNGVTVLNNIGNAQYQNTTNAYTANGQTAPPSHPENEMNVKTSSAVVLRDSCDIPATG